MFPINNPHYNTKPLQKRTQPEPKKVSKIEEVLEVQEGEEVSDKEELITKFYVQRGALPRHRELLNLSKV